MTLGEDVEVEEDAFGRIFRRFAAIDGVLLTFDGTRVVFVAAEGVGDAEIGLENAAKHFLVELFLEGFGGMEIGGGVVVFGLEIGGDARILFVAEPGVVVDAAIVVDDVLDGLSLGERRVEACGAGLGRSGRSVGPGVGGQMSSGGIEIGDHFGFSCERDRAKGIVKWDGMQR